MTVGNQLQWCNTATNWTECGSVAAHHQFIRAGWTDNETSSERTAHVPSGTFSCKHGCRAESQGGIVVIIPTVHVGCLRCVPHAKAPRLRLPRDINCQQLPWSDVTIGHPVTLKESHPPGYNASIWRTSCTSIHPFSTPMPSGARASRGFCWSPSQLTQGEGRLTPGTSLQLVPW